MAEGAERLSHLYVAGHATDEAFRRTGGGSVPRRSVTRATHGQGLRSEAGAAFSAADEERTDFDVELLRATGSIIVIEGADATHVLKLESLDRKQGQWLLLSVTVAEDRSERAQVWVADQHRHRFLAIFDDYLSKDTPNGKPTNEPLVANIARIRSALLRDLWQSDGEPPTGTQWWELWLRPEPDGEELVRRFAEVNGLAVATDTMVLDQRIILWIHARWDQLEVLPATAVPVAEIRSAQFVDTITDFDTDGQTELVDDLTERVQPASGASPAVCLLDSGVRRTHVLLESSLASNDWHSITVDGPGDTATPPRRHGGHGTQMAGLALYGPLDGPLLSADPVQLLHGLESVKILPDIAPHDPKSYGLVTAQAVATPETTAARRRVFCLPVTAPHERSDDPSLWSSSIDALAAGTDVGREGDRLTLLGPPNPDAARLIVVSAGNTDLPTRAPVDYLAECDLQLLQDPAQAWNALVVGAATNLTDTPKDPSFAGWSPIAPAGELSPHSRTGVRLSSKWPVRPDICMEGGNVLTDGTDLNERHSVVSLASTDRRSDSALDVANATSAACAAASRLAARAMATYPSFWPETVRGLIVHGAEWTNPMWAHVRAATTVAAKRAVLGRYGWGIPTDETVLTSGRRAVTLVTEDRFVPFSGRDFAMRQFRLHQLPWPKDVLADLGAISVRLRITLSYFIEPSASRRGWKNRYAYRSHGLRFDLKTPTENVNDFIRRVGRTASDEEGGHAPSRSSGSDRWVMGPKTRDNGSVHSDIWEGSGADLANCGAIAIYPVGGWWKSGARADRCELPVRYALLVSLATDEVGVDLYHPIAIQLAGPIEGVSIEV